MPAPRSSGVQLHVTSLPGGRLGAEAFRFVDWLRDAGQSWWQVLPLGPPDRHRSPYRSASAFAAWPGLLGDPDAPVSGAETDAFRRREATWVDGWERYVADPGEDSTGVDLGDASQAVADQVRFDREWAALRSYAAERGVRLIGDVPIYVAPDGADRRQHPELFRDGVVGGAPPDAFSETGQHWGNPVYDWPALQRRDYRWWTARMARLLGQVDLARLDHFRGFVAYWAVPEDAPDASTGRWARGPGAALFRALERELAGAGGGAGSAGAAASAGSGGVLPFIAEDLGVITPAVERLRDGLGLPGMVVLQFGFDPDDPRGPHRPANHREDQVLYTGTHDNDTLRGWWNGLDEATRAEADAAVDAAGAREAEPWWSLTRLAMTSPARLVMLQAQDVLGLGSEARMNLPGTTDGSWRFRLEPGQLTAAHAARLRAATEAGGR